MVDRGMNSNGMLPLKLAALAEESRVLALMRRVPKIITSERPVSVRKVSGKLGREEY